jgi:hypothetical protein
VVVVALGVVSFQRRIELIVLPKSGEPLPSASKVCQCPNL